MKLLLFVVSRGVIQLWQQAMARVARDRVGQLPPRSLLDPDFQSFISADKIIWLPASTAWPAEGLPCMADLLLQKLLDHGPQDPSVSTGLRAQFLNCRQMDA